MTTLLNTALAEWRGIYLIFDTRDAKAYVGSAYGSENILGRWRSYADSGHGGHRPAASVRAARMTETKVKMIRYSPLFLSPHAIMITAWAVRSIRV